MFNEITIETNISFDLFWCWTASCVSEEKLTLCAAGEDGRALAEKLGGVHQMCQSMILRDRNGGKMLGKFVSPISFRSFHLGISGSKILSLVRCLVVMPVHWTASGAIPEYPASFADWIRWSCGISMGFHGFLVTSSPLRPCASPTGDVWWADSAACWRRSHHRSALANIADCLDERPGCKPQLTTFEHKKRQRKKRWFFYQVSRSTTSSPDGRLGLRGLVWPGAAEWSTSTAKTANTVRSVFMQPVI